jgi:hypothetical protein
MGKVLKDWFTEPDGKSYCLVKAIAGSGALVYFSATMIHVYINHAFDYQAFGIGLGAIMGGAGAGLMMKKDTPL